MLLRTKVWYNMVMDIKCGGINGFFGGFLMRYKGENNGR